MASKKICKEDGCTTHVWSKGFCNRHYREHGLPLPKSYRARCTKPNVVLGISNYIEESYHDTPEHWNQAWWEGYLCALTTYQVIDEQTFGMLLKKVQMYSMKGVTC